MEVCSVVNALSRGLVLTVLTLSCPVAQIPRKVTPFTLEERHGNITSLSGSSGFLQIKLQPLGGATDSGFGVKSQ